MHRASEFPTVNNSNSEVAHVSTSLQSLTLEAQAVPHVAFVVDRMALQCSPADIIPPIIRTYSSISMTLHNLGSGQCHPVTQIIKRQMHKFGCELYDNTKYIAVNRVGRTQ